MGVELTLQLNQFDAEALTAYASGHGQSLEEAAIEGVRTLIHVELRKAFIQEIIERDRELLRRLAR